MSNIFFQGVGIFFQGGSDPLRLPGCGTSQNRRQKVFNVGFYVCSGLTMQKLTKLPLFIVFHISILGVWSIFVGA